MEYDYSVKVAAERAWSVHLAAHKDVNAADHRRSLLERYLYEKWRAGEREPEELTYHGLSYLARLPGEDH
jgi:hypothetical protein